MADSLGWRRVAPLIALLLLAPIVSEMLFGQARSSFMFAVVPQIGVCGRRSADQPVVALPQVAGEPRGPALERKELRHPYGEAIARPSTGGKLTSWPQARTGIVSVRVTDTDMEDPIFQADVRLYTFGHGGFSFRAYTDGSGRKLCWARSRQSSARWNSIPRRYQRRLVRPETPDG